MKFNSDNYYKLIVVFLLFLLLTFDTDLAMIYILIMIADWIWFRSDNFVSFPIFRSGQSKARIYGEAIIATGLFIFISTVLVKTFQPNVISGSGVIAGAQSIFNLLSTAIPFFKGNAFLTAIAWGLIVPIIESVFFFGRLLEGFATYGQELTKTKINLTKITGTLMVVVLFIASLFTLFHITAKGLDSTALLITFTFAVMSCILVIRQKQLAGAITMHILVNSMAILASLGVIGI